MQPRYWVEEGIVDSAIPKFPEPLAEAVALDDAESVRHILGVWAAGYLFNRGRTEDANQQLGLVAMLEVADRVRRALDAFGEQLVAAGKELELRYRLDEFDLQRIKEAQADPWDIARELLNRFSPKWLMGWRDITNSTNERTTIASALPRAAVGDTFLLMFLPTVEPSLRACLIASLNSFAQDFCARQKVGGTHMKYNVFRQLAVLPPARLATITTFCNAPAFQWISRRAAELLFTANDLANLGTDVDCRLRHFDWDENRRSQIRCELDSAFFHLYLPSNNDGTWKPSEVAVGNVTNETPAHLAALTRHFPTPRHAVAHILDSFPLVRKKDEEAHGRYRTKERILEIYDQMLEAQRTGSEWVSPLQPPPGTRP